MPILQGRGSQAGFPGVAALPRPGVVAFHLDARADPPEPPSWIFTDSTVCQVESQLTYGRAC